MKPRHPRSSPRLRAYMLLRMAGMTHKEIASEFGVRVDTVTKTLKNGREKHDAANSLQLMAAMIVKGEINIDDLIKATGYDGR